MVTLTSYRGETFVVAVAVAGEEHDGDARRPLEDLAQRPERGAHLLREQLQLFPRGEVTAAVEPVVVDEVVRVGALCPAARGLVELVWEHADARKSRCGSGGFRWQVLMCQWSRPLSFAQSLCVSLPI
jgi:hypothetical protein